MNQTLHVHVAYAERSRQLVVAVELPAGATVNDAIEKALPQLQAAFPDADFAALATGIWGEAADRAKGLQADDRVEVYRQLTADPKFARRSRVAQSAKLRPPGSTFRR
ncbi:MAG: hypothetical protein RJB26_2638 [Pseudomonadota bacterium]|jgi:putative ubiquitin-RnfH superfamily antitoxin RatB of RatAB toxin-antitoxin module